MRRTFGQFSNNGVTAIRELQGDSLFGQAEAVGPVFLFMEEGSPNLPLATGTIADMRKFIEDAGDVDVVDHWLSVPFSQRDHHAVEEVIELKQRGVIIAGAKEVVETFYLPAPVLSFG